MLGGKTIATQRGINFCPTVTFDKQVAGGADGSRLASGGAGEAAAVFSERLADHHSCKSVLVADLEVDGALNLVVLSEPHDDGSGVAADLTLQSHRLTLCHRHVLQALNREKGDSVRQMEIPKLPGSSSIHLKKAAKKMKPPTV